MDNLKCGFLTSRGFPCPNYCKHIYNGTALCNVHLNTIKANEECCICLSPMCNPLTRIKLACGHYHHIHCLGKMVNHSCPVCIQELTPSECHRVFYEPKVKPLIDRVFSMNGRKQRVAFGLMGDIINYIDSIGNTDEIDVFRSYTGSYFTGMRILRNAGINERPGDIMFDWVDIMAGAFSHIHQYHTYAGFQLEVRGLVASWSSRNLVVEQEYELAPTRPSSPYAAMIMPRSPSPVLPWYVH
jgi:hypothetical protein